MIQLAAPAKINLFLEITGKRQDGYHLLSTVFHTISLGDRLTFRAAPSLRLTCSESSLPTDERNLVMRAALKLQALLQEPRGAWIHLEKKTPMGAGLGGGSSDAATALRGLLRLWKKRVPEHTLHRLARTLGADVPFFLKGGCCVGCGIGDQLTSLPKLPKTWMVLVYPDFGVSTKEAYARVHLPWSNPQRLNRSALRKAWTTTTSTRLFNRFEPLVFPDHPELPKLKQSLLDLGARGALMSGSGSTIIGIASSKAHAQKMLSAVRKRYNQSWLVQTL